MREDRLRALRAMRFASRFGFTIEPATWAAIVESAPFLKRLLRERLDPESLPRDVRDWLYSVRAAHKKEG